MPTSAATFRKLDATCVEVLTKRINQLSRRAVGGETEADHLLLSYLALGSKVVEDHCNHYAFFPDLDPTTDDAIEAEFRDEDPHILADHDHEPQAVS